ncbi:hypothetical protein D5086_000276, partial [Populus alba]
MFGRKAWRNDETGFIPQQEKVRRLEKTLMVSGFEVILFDFSWMSCEMMDKVG